MDTVNAAQTPAVIPPRTRYDMKYAATLTLEELRAESAYRLAAFADKKVIHPGGRFSTRRVLKAAQLDTARHVLEVGCGVGYGALKIAKRAAKVTAIDIDPAMLERAYKRAQAAPNLTVEEASVEALPYADATFDRAVIESVTMFTDRDRSIPEIHRVLEPGGLVVDHEFCWSSEPTAWRKKTFARQFGDGACELPAAWVKRYEDAGFVDVRVATGPVLNFTPPGLVIDEGPLDALRFFGRLATRAKFARRMGSFLWDLNRLIPWIRYMVLTAKKPAVTSQLNARGLPLA